jgi:hypothetical protein
VHGSAQLHGQVVKYALSRPIDCAVSVRAESAVE